MSPGLALIICTVFIAIILFTDKKISIPMWLVLFWFMLIASRSVAAWLNVSIGEGTPSDYFEGNPIDRTILTICILLGSIICLKRNVSIILFIRENIFIFILFVYYGISIMWSEYPFVSMKRYIKASGNILMVLIVLTEKDPIQAFKDLMRKCSYILIPTSILLIKYFPSYGRSYHRYSGELSIRGVALNKNGLGATCLVVGLYLFFEFYNAIKNKTIRSDRYRFTVNSIILLMAVYLLVSTDSATSLTCFIFGVGIIMILRYLYKKSMLLYLPKYFLALLFFSVTIFIIGEEIAINKYLAIAGHEDTFWGRVNFWPELISMMEGSYIFGLGYDSFWLGNRMDILWNKYWWRPTEAHNGYVEVFLELGIIGVILHLSMLVSIIRKIFKNILINFEFGTLQVMFFIVIIAYNFMESAFKGLHTIWFVFLLVAIEYNRKYKNNNSIINTIQA